MRRELLMIISTMVIMFGFQNCSDVQFDEVDTSNQIAAGEPGAELPEVIDARNEDNESEDEGNGDDKDNDTDNDDDNDHERDNDDVDNGKDKDDDEKGADNHDPGNLEPYLCNKPNGNTGVIICHFPPGNPAAKHSLCIGIRALEAHLHHSREESDDPQDHLGHCI